jgi:hypothetical protein
MIMTILLSSTVGNYQIIPLITCDIEEKYIFSDEETNMSGPMIYF